MKKNLKLSVKGVAALIASTLLLGGAIGGTMAWLTAESTAVVNEFTTSEVGVTVTETKNDFKMVPGSDIAKDPVVTVVDGSESCYVYVEITAANNAENYITYTLRDGWTNITDTNIYYYETALSAGETAYVLAEGDGVLGNGYVHVKESVTKDMMETAKTTAPTLTFKAYAVQSANITDYNNDGTVDALDAWRLAHANP